MTISNHMDESAIFGEKLHLHTVQIALGFSSCNFQFSIFAIFSQIALSSMRLPMHILIYLRSCDVQLLYYGFLKTSIPTLNHLRKSSKAKATDNSYLALTAYHYEVNQVMTAKQS